MKTIILSVYEYIWDAIISKFPSHTLRYLYIKLLNKSIKSSTAILMNVRFKGLKNIEFSDNLVINQNVTLDGRGGLFLGENVDIAERVVIWSMSHDPHDNNHSTLKKKTIISDYAWVGADSIILSGVNVGEGAVIGSGSVVTKDVEAFTIVAGNPARVISKRKSIPEYEIAYKPFLK